MAKKCVSSPSVSLYDALRNSGHNSFSAVCETLDNLFEDEVKATQCKIDVVSSEENKNEIGEIRIGDNGIGMNLNTLHIYFGLGESNKTRSKLGCYGVGGKVGSYSIGRQLKVYTKQKGGELLLAVQDLDEIKTDRDFVYQLYGEDEISQTEKDMFNEMTSGGEQGTVIVISKIDRISETKKTYCDKIKETIQRTYSKLLETKSIQVFLNDKEINKISYISGKPNCKPEVISPLQNYEYNGMSFQVESYFLPTQKGIIEPKDYDYPCTHRTSGIFIFRNNRLVGSAMKLDGIGGVGGDGHLTGFRTFVYLDGDFDHLVGSTFNKQMNDSVEIDSDFRACLENIIAPFRSKSKKLRDNLVDNEKCETREEENKSLTEIAKKIGRDSGIHITTSKHKNTKREKDDTEKKEVHRSVINPFRNRDGEVEESKTCHWLDSIKKVNYLAPYDPWYMVTKVKDKFSFELNINNPYYKEFVEKLSYQQQVCLLMPYIAFALTLSNDNTISWEERNVRSDNFYSILEKSEQYLKKLIEGENRISKAQLEILSNVG